MAAKKKDLVMGTRLLAENAVAPADAPQRAAAKATKSQAIGTKELRTEKLQLRVTPTRFREFKAECARRGEKMSDVAERWIDEYLAQAETAL